MSGFLFYVVLVFSVLFILVGVGLYVVEKLHNSDNISEIKIFGLNPSTFYIISMLSLIVLCCLYDNPVSVTWKTQHKLDSVQNKKIDSLESVNAFLVKNQEDLKQLLELHHQLDEKIISTMGKRDVVIINNNHHRKMKRHCKRDSIPCDKRKQCSRKNVCSK